MTAVATSTPLSTGSSRTVTAAAKVSVVAAWTEIPVRKY